MEKVNNENRLMKHGWNGDRTCYVCAERITINIRQRMVARQKRPSIYLPPEEHATPQSKLARNTNGVPSNCLNREYNAVVSGMCMSRDMESIIRSAEDTKEVVFPQSVRGVE